MTGGWDGESAPAEAPGGRKGAESPNRVAERILESMPLVTDRTETVYRYEGGPWRELHEITLLSMALAAEGVFHSKASRRGEIVSFIKAHSHDPDLSWGRVGAHQIGCRNGILDVVTFRLSEHSPENYLERVLPHDFDPGAECPAWMDFLDDCFGDSHEGGEAAALQCFFGYIAFSHAKYKKALLLQGPGDTGKSVIEKVARVLVGADQCCSLSVEHMDDPVLRGVIKGKALNSMTELPASAMIADSGFKTMVSTEDALFISEKWKKPENYVPTAKHLIACNTLPRLNERTEATYARLLIVPLRRPVAPADQDPELPARLTAEMPGILRWAAEGARALFQAGGTWPDVPAARAIMTEYRDDINPVGAFLRECCRARTGWAQSLRVLNDAYNRLGYSGGKRTNVREFGKLARASCGEHAVKDVKFVTTYNSRRLTLKALMGWELAADSLPDGCEVPAAEAAGDAREINASQPPVSREEVD